MINEKHDGILNGPRVLLLRDKFNKSLIIFKIDARIFIYTRKTSILTAMHSCKCFILRIFKKKKILSLIAHVLLIQIIIYRLIKTNIFNFSF